MSVNEQKYIPEVEGEIQMIYGPIGGGKNTLATTQILKDLQKGMTVFATWKVKFDGLDERKSIFAVILGIFGLKRKYYRISGENFHYLSLKEMMQEDFMKKLYGMTNLAIYVDEAYAARLFDSYRKTSLSVEERMAVYITRHVNRKFVIVAQRTNAIHVSSRALVNRFYKCEQLMPIFIAKWLGLYIFRRTEFQDMQDETVDETKPYATTIKFMRSTNPVFKAFDSKYMREGMVDRYIPDNSVFDYGYISRWGLLSQGLRFGRSPALTQGAPVVFKELTSQDRQPKKSIRNIFKANKQT